MTFHFIIIIFHQSDEQGKQPETLILQYIFLSLK